MKPYYQDSHCTIYHADCREVLPGLAPVDLVLTDPPYGIGKADWDGEVPTGWLDGCRFMLALLVGSLEAVVADGAAGDRGEPARRGNLAAA
jgi:DNA modification methylase